jgi:2,5-diamino-6-(ribosylamino)-4(3H)-pyrimidinone 5'-phosphate reductase
MNRPFVFINMAMTADGKIATAHREAASFGSRRDREHLLELRAQADAVMAGARTVAAGDINLGPGPARYRRLRRQRGLTEYNLRVIVSGRGSIHAGATVFRHRFSPIIVLTTDRISATKLKQLQSLADEVMVCGKAMVDFPAALRRLQEQRGVKRLLCEGGGELNDALLRAGLVDELHLTVCPRIFAGRAAPTLADGVGCARLPEAAELELKSRQRRGDELFLVFRVKRRMGKLFS